MGIRKDENKTMKTAQKESLTFEQVYLQYIKPVYIVAYGILKSREDAEDVAHDVFLTFFGKNESEQIKDIKNYLLKMAHNKSINYLRKRDREEPAEDISERITSVMENNDNTLLEEIEKEICRLPAEERQVFMMHVNAGLGFRQISNIMEISVPAAYRIYKRAVKTLRQAIKLKGGEYNE